MIHHYGKLPDHDMFQVWRKADFLQVGEPSGGNIDSGKTPQRHPGKQGGTEEVICVTMIKVCRSHK
jgi:hypothetical protein